MNKRRKPNRYSDNNMNRKKEEQMQKPRMRHFYYFRQQNWRFRYLEQYAVFRYGNRGAHITEEQRVCEEVFLRIRRVATK
jgi:hypothetical protein